MVKKSAKKKKKGPTRQELKARKRCRQGLVVRSAYIRVYARTLAEYRRICSHVKWYRILVRYMISKATALLGSTIRVTTIEPVPAKQRKAAKTRQDNQAKAAAKKGKSFTPKPIPRKRTVVRFDYKAYAKLVEQLFGQKGCVSFYWMRPLIMMFFKDIVKHGGPQFGSHTWDTARDRLSGMVNTRLPDYNGATRSALVLSGALDNIRCKRLGMPVLCAPDSDNIHAWVRETGKELAVTLRPGPQKAEFDLVACGGPVVMNNEPFVPQLNAGHKRLLHKLATGEWKLTTPTINLNNDGSLFLHVTYVAEARRGENFEHLDKKRILEVCFKRVRGSELPRRKNDTGKDDDKVFVIHCFERGTTRKFRVPVNDVVADMNRYAAQHRARELQRDCRRKWRRGLVNPLKEKIRQLTKKRELRQRDANHAWTHWIVKMADRWSCGTIKVFGPPDGAEAGLLLDGTLPWRWFEFMTQLNYKAREAGMALATRLARPAIIDELFKREEEAVAAKNEEDDDGRRTAAATV